MRSLCDNIISIHALREESDYAATHDLFVVAISIHALREESDQAVAAFDAVLVISIHALREESDPLLHKRVVAADGISIHALREESDRTPKRSRPRGRYFNPRSP